MRFLLPLMLIVAGCMSTPTACIDAAACDVEVDREIAIEKLEILHFHGRNQCYSCITVGNYAEETVQKHFAEELESGKVVFRHVNGELPENRELLVKYGATGSSLWLGTYTKEGGFTAEQNINVWYKINDKNGYMDYLKGVIEEKLR